MSLQRLVIRQIVSLRRTGIVVWTDTDRWRRDDKRTSRAGLRRPTVRSFHSTERREILPLIGAAALLVIGRYSWKALQRMDAEWEDYQWELARYEKQLARNSPDYATAISKAVAIDLGSIYTKLAFSHPQPEVAVSREGDRAFFNGLVYGDDHDDEHIARGRAALERFYYEIDDRSGNGKEKVTLPWKSFEQSSGRAAKVVWDCIGSALTEALERMDYKTDEHPAIRKVITVPVQYLHSDVYATAFSGLIMSDGGSATFLPEPVATIWGAQAKSVLPVDDETARTVLVLDVGGLVTQLSVVRKDIVLHSLALPLGGETLIQLLVELLRKDAPSSIQDARSLSALQVQARSAAVELSAKTRVSVHVPYLFADPSNHHLDMDVSRVVLEQALNEYIRHNLTADLQDDHVLSPHMPTPRDLASLWISVITQLLENSNQIPANIDHVLLVGGGSRAPVTIESLRAALLTLFGVDAPNKLVVPESALLSELTVLGAATMLPSYEYSVDDGLLRAN